MGLALSLGLGEADSCTNFFPKAHMPGAAEKGIGRHKPVPGQITHLPLRRAPCRPDEDAVSGSPRKLERPHHGRATEKIKSMSEASINLKVSRAQVIGI